MRGKGRHCHRAKSFNKPKASNTYRPAFGTPVRQRTRTTETTSKATDYCNPYQHTAASPHGETANAISYAFMPPQPPRYGGQSTRSKQSTSKQTGV